MIITSVFHTPVGPGSSNVRGREGSRRARICDVTFCPILRIAEPCHSTSCGAVRIKSSIAFILDFINSPSGR